MFVWFTLRKISNRHYCHFWTLSLPLMAYIKLPKRKHLEVHIFWRRYYFHTNFNKTVTLCNVRYVICGSPGIAHQQYNKWPDNFEKSNQNTLVSSLHMSQKIIMQNKNISWENSFAKIVQKWSILTPISVVFKHLSFTR